MTTWPTTSVPVSISVLIWLDSKADWIFILPSTSSFSLALLVVPIPKLPLGIFTFPPVLATKISAELPLRLTLDVRPAIIFIGTEFEILTKLFP